MRIMDKQSNKELFNVLIMLTPIEAKQLGDFMKNLTTEKGDHIHVGDENYSREITLAIYTPENTQFFHENVRRLIEGT